MARKNAKGAGTIRKKTVTRNGKEYTYWEARVTAGRDPGTGKQIQRSFTGKTQKEVRKKMQAAAVEINQGTYTAPSKMTVGQWLDIWQRDYLGAVKLSTADGYVRWTSSAPTMYRALSTAWRVLPPPRSDTITRYCTPPWKRLWSWTTYRETRRRGASFPA